MSESFRFVGEGFHRDTPRLCEAFWSVDRPVDVFYSGQINHERRQKMMEMLTDDIDMKNGAGAVCVSYKLQWNYSMDVIATEGFSQGYHRAEYLQRMCRSKVALCPSGPRTPDSFRVYEALEAGCVPIVDGHCPAYSEAGYWDLVAPGAPFPIIDDWADLPDLLAETLAGWPDNAAACRDWWTTYKRGMVGWLDADLDSIGAPTDVARSLAWTPAEALRDPWE